MRNLISVLVISLFSSFTTAYAADTYTIDPMHSHVIWHINHFGYSNPSGKWMANGTLILDEAKPENSKVTVDIDVAKVITGIDKLDTHLKSDEFFDVEKYPTATFVSDKVDVLNNKTARVYGLLTLHGVSKPVMLNVRLNKMAESPLNHKMTVGFTATTKIKRSDFGISKYLPGLGDEVTLDIEAEASKT